MPLRNGLITRLLGIRRDSPGIGYLPEPPVYEGSQLRNLPDGPRDCVLVLDASGSMLANDWKPSRLGAAKEAAQELCLRLSREESDARVAIVAYGSDASALCALTSVTEDDVWKPAIDEIDCMGGTNIHAGLKEATRLLKFNRRVG